MDNKDYRSSHYTEKIAEHNVKLSYIEKQIETISNDVKEIKAIIDNYLSFLFSKNKMFIISLFIIGAFFGSALTDSKASDFIVSILKRI